MLMGPEEAEELNRLLRLARSARLDHLGEQQLRALLGRYDVKALTMSREDLYRVGFFTSGLNRIVDVAEGRAVIVDKPRQPAS